MTAYHRRDFLTAASAAGFGLAFAAPSRAAGPADIGDEVALGNPRAKVTVIEYASASCPHCAHWAEEVFPAFKAKYIDTGKVRFVFREFLTAPPQVAAAGFLIARCAGKDRYFAALDQVFKSQKEWQASGSAKAPLLKVAANFGMNEQQAMACIQNQAEIDRLVARVKRAAEVDKITATPTFIVNGKTLSGAQTLAQLDAVIQPLLR